MIRLKLIRTILTPKVTIGELTIEGMLPKYFTLEDTVRADGVKVYGETAIPHGTYRIKYQFSNHFQKEMPYLQDVPNFEGIMIHIGNFPKDTFGCILVGMNYLKIDEENYQIVNSTKAFTQLNMILQQHRNDEMIIEIV